MEITKKEFEKYQEIKKSGKVNMFDSARVEMVCGLKPFKTRYILVHYKELERKYQNGK